MPINLVLKSTNLKCSLFFSMAQFRPDPLQALDGKRPRLAPVRRPTAGPPVRTDEGRTPGPAHPTAQVPGDERLVERFSMHHPQP